MSWPTEELGKIGKFIRGITFKPKDIVKFGERDSIVCMRTKNVQSELDKSDLISIPKSFVKRQEQFLAEGDLLVSSANSWNLVGKCCWVPELNYKATAGGFISIYRGCDDYIYKRYLYHWFKSSSVQAALRKCSRQTTNISNLSIPQAEKIKIPLPPLQEQKRIAAILDKADEIRRKREEAIKLCDEFLKSVFLEMFGDPVTNPKGWEVVRLGHLIDVVSGGTPSKANPEYWSGEFPWVSPKDMKVKLISDAQDHISELAFKENKIKKVPKNSLLIVIRGMILSHTIPVAVTSRPVSINQDMKALIPKKRIQPIFLLWALLCQHDYILSKVSTAAHGTKRLESRELHGLSIPVPSLEKQKQFENICSHHSNMITAFDKHKVDTLNLNQTLDVLMLVEKPYTLNFIDELFDRK